MTIEKAVKKYNKDVLSFECFESDSVEHLICELEDAGDLSFKVINMERAGDYWYQAEVGIIKSGVMYGIVFDYNVSIAKNSFEDFVASLERIEKEAKRVKQLFK